MELCSAVLLGVSVPLDRCLMWCVRPWATRRQSVKRLSWALHNALVVCLILQRHSYTWYFVLFVNIHALELVVLWFICCIFILLFDIILYFMIILIILFILEILFLLAPLVCLIRRHGFGSLSVVFFRWRLIGFLFFMLRRTVNIGGAFIHSRAIVSNWYILCEVGQQ